MGHLCSRQRSQRRRTPDSDLDIALLLPPGERIADPLNLAASLAAVASRDVDIADLRRAGNFLCKEVLAHGETLYVANPEQVLNWEAIAMSEYATHRERIRDLLDDFNKTGIGYAHAMRLSYSRSLHCNAALRARSTYRTAGPQFRSNHDSQDVVILNILRACETASDLANMAIRSHRLGIQTMVVNRFQYCSAKDFSMKKWRAA